MHQRRRRIGVAVAAALALTACGSVAGPEARLDATSPVTAERGATTTTSGAALEPKAILTATKRSVAFVSNPVGTGSGVLLPSGYVVTNAHVVQPFAEVRLVFPEGPTIDKVPVVGVDAWTDIAVLGPVKVDNPPLPVDSADGLEQGDRVYLIGYPDETEKRPTPTITQGIVSRLRSSTDFGTHYVMTDATIAGGQSGGALVDGRGRVVGISGYSLDGFGIALRANDVAASVQRILDGKGSRYRTLPTGAGAVTKGTVKLDATTPIGALYLPPSTQERKVSLKLGDPNAALQVFDLFDYTTYATNGIAEAEYIAALPAERQADERNQLELVTPGADGAYSFTVAADGHAVISLGPFKDNGPHDVTFEVSPAAQPIEGLDTLEPLMLGTSVEGVVNSFDSVRGYSLTLRKGQAIDLSLVAPMGLIGISIEGPGVDPTGNTEGSFTETDETPFESSIAKTTFTAPADGAFRIYVASEDDSLVGFRLTVR